MQLRRLASLTALAVAAVAVFAPCAWGARNLAGVPGNLTEQAVSQDFVVHYTTAAGDPSAITPEDAQQLIVTAERALGDSGSRLNLPAPMDDGDGHADVYVYAGAAQPPEPGIVRADTRDDRTTGWIGIPPASTGDIVAVTHEVVHLQQLALYRPAGRVLAEGSATWAPLDLYSNELRTLPDVAQLFADDPLDCDDPGRCSAPGYNAWRFFELLAEREGPQVVRSLYDRSRTLGAKDHRSHLIEAVGAELAGRGTTLPQAFSDYTAANLAGGYSLAGLAKRRYGGTEPFDDLATGRRSRRFRPRGVTLDHLAAAFYRIRSGSDSPVAASTRCHRARLQARLQGPADLEGPVFWAPFRPRTGKPRAVTLVKGKAIVDLPWSTCGGREVGIGFDNPSAGVDRRTFTVTLRLAVRR